MNNANSTQAPKILVALVFAIVFIVWGSTYFFIKMAVQGFPPMLLGAARYITAGILMLAWCAFKGDKLFVRKDVITAAVNGLLMLFVGTGIAFWVERFIPSAMVAIMVSANPIWFVVLDRANWKLNVTNKATLSGLVIGFSGIVLLFGESLSKSVHSGFDKTQLIGMLLLVAGPIAWSAGGLYSKKHPGSGPARLGTAWQMLIAGFAFIPAAAIHGEFSSFHFSEVPAQSWAAIAYLVTFGSIIAFSAYIWLLQVKPAVQVSTHSYINPVIAVLLGVLFAGEHMSLLQLAGLLIILFSVLLINLSKYKMLNFRTVGGLNTHPAGDARKKGTLQITDPHRQLLCPK